MELRKLPQEASGDRLGFITFSPTMLPSDPALALNSRITLLGSYREFLWAPLVSPTFFLVAGQRLDFLLGYQFHYN